LAKRQNEINEWEAGNKRDTLFIYQMMLVGLSLTIILVVFSDTLLPLLIFTPRGGVCLCT
jgi:hypothetical protein